MSVYLFVEIGFMTLLRLIYHFCVLWHTPSAPLVLVPLTQVDIAVSVRPMKIRENSC